MDSMALLEKFREENPTRKIIYLNAENEKYDSEYVDFNLDILREGLLSAELDFEVNDTSIYIYGEGLFERFLFDCAIFLARAENGVIIKPFASICDIMSTICRIKAFFKK